MPKLKRRNRHWTEKEKQFLLNFHDKHTLKELAEELGRPPAGVRRMLGEFKLKSKPELKEYAVYKGDEFLVLGTAEECAKFLDIDPKRIHVFAHRASYGKAGEDEMLAIKVEDDDCE